jgi:choline dehydrogenase-like flavoprotein
MLKPAVDNQLDGAEFDAIVVGSGPAGATIARELSKRRQRVLILERGADAPPGGGLRSAVSIVNTVPVGDNLATARAFATGGTTAVYFAVVDFPPLETFLSLGVDLSRALEEAKRELPLAVLPDELFGAQAIKVRDSALDLGYDWRKNPMLVDQSKCASGYTREARWTARQYVLEAVADGATLINRATVLKAIVEKKRAIGVEYKIQKGKKEFETRRAFGAKIILSAGATASPIILRDSGIRTIASGGFCFYPGFAVFGTVPGLKAGENFVGSMGAIVDEDMALGDANLASSLYRMFMIGRGRFIRAFRHSRSIGVGVSIKERLGGGLQEDGRYYKLLTKEDIGMLDKGEHLARQIIQNAGGKHIFKSPVSASHLGGVIRIKEHVDENLQTEYANLYVCDGSVLPESFRGAPTLTLICLGKYLANHLQ